MVEVFPFLESSLVDGELNLLASSTWECRIGFGSEIAFTVSMEEGDVSD